MSKFFPFTRQESVADKYQNHFKQILETKNAWTADVHVSDMSFNMYINK